MDVAKLWSEIAHDGHLWALCGVAMALGIVGGIAQAFASADGGRPGWRTLLQRGLLGAVAAGAVLYVATPASGVALVKASPVEPDVRVTTQQTLSLGEDRVVLAANLTADITRAGIFRTAKAPASVTWRDSMTTSDSGVAQHVRTRPAASSSSR